ncbi:MAG: CvpA family protein, partial [Bacilli bacterium]|nr:CvpA family protein [Bacilli bacterium]
MGVVDIVIIMLLIFGAIKGFKNGLTTQLFSFVGFILVVVLAYMLKNPVSSILYSYLPFFNFDGIFKGVTVLNVALYEMIAFVALFVILYIIFQIALTVTKVFEKVLKMTIILGIPSKILGAIVGVLEYYIVIFVILYITTLPLISWKELDNSKTRVYILENTPVLSQYTEKSLEVMDEFKLLVDEYKNTTNPDNFNLATLDLFLKYNVIDIDTAVKLYENKKLKVGNFYSIICKYEEE